MTRILIILFILAEISAQAQYPSKVYTPVQFDDIKAGKIFKLPGDTVKGLQKDSLALSWAHDGCIYANKGNGWKKVWCDTSTGTPPAPLVFRFIQQPLDTTVTSGASFPLRATVANGTGPYPWSWYQLGFGGSVASSITSLPTVTATMPIVTSDARYYVRVYSDANGYLTSDTNHITVSAIPTITYGYASTDPFVNSSTAPTIGSPTTTTITHNANIVFNLPAGAADKYWVVKEPITEPLKASWYHNTDNSGPIPGDVVRVWTVGSFRYYASVSEFVLTYTDSIQLLQ